MMMAGRAAEELVFGEFTSGAADDLNRAAALARRMVGELGMGARHDPRQPGDRPPRRPDRRRHRPRRRRPRGASSRRPSTPPRGCSATTAISSTSPPTPSSPPKPWSGTTSTPSSAPARRPAASTPRDPSRPDPSPPLSPGPALRDPGAPTRPPAGLRHASFDVTPDRRRVTHTPSRPGPRFRHCFGADRGGLRAHPGAMAKSLYKARGMGSRPPCAICMGPGRGPREQLRLPFGLRSGSAPSTGPRSSSPGGRGGTSWSASRGVWTATGCPDGRPAARRCARTWPRIAPPGPAPRPGSYAWPDLRQRGRGAVRARRAAAARSSGSSGAGTPGDAAQAPSRRTMQRWFSEGRWLTDGTPPAPLPPPGGGGPSGGPVAGDGDRAPTVSSGRTRMRRDTEVGDDRCAARLGTLIPGGLHVRRAAHRHRDRRAPRGTGHPGLPRAA